MRAATVTQPPLSSTPGWGDRIEALEAALSRSGMTRLLGPMGQIRAYFASRGGVLDEEATRLLARALGEVRACVADAGRTFDPELLVRLEPEAARELFDSLLGADDSAIETLVAAVGEGAAPAPASKARDELGTLREPLASQQPGAARVLMKGELQPGLLTDLIQLFSQNTETGSLFLEGKTSSASIFFKDGRIVDAACGEETGERAFFLAMLVREGRFSYQRGVEAPTPRIFRSAQHLIMDTLRLIDEST
jgi:hypothetical protein